MEMMAVIVGLEALKERCKVALCSDSKYVLDALSKGWAARWRANGWRRNRREPAVNPDLWERLLDLCEGHDVTFHWVKGHSGNLHNERCDRLATEAAAQPGAAGGRGVRAHGPGVGPGQTQVDSAHEYFSARPTAAHQDCIRPS